MVFSTLTNLIRRLKMKELKKILCVFCLGLMLNGVLMVENAQTDEEVVYQDGTDNAFVADYDGTDDAFIASGTAGQEQLRNYGGQGSLYVGKTGTGTIERSLLRFDLSSLAEENANVEITSATLTLRVLAPPPGSTMVRRSITRCLLDRFIARHN